MVVAFHARDSGKKKRAQRLTFWVWRPPGGEGVFHAKGRGRKVRALPRKFVLLSREFCWDVPDPSGCSITLSREKIKNGPEAMVYGRPRSRKTGMSDVDVTCALTRNGVASAAQGIKVVLPGQIEFLYMSVRRQTYMRHVTKTIKIFQTIGSWMSAPTSLL